MGEKRFYKFLSNENQMIWSIRDLKDKKTDILVRNDKRSTDLLLDLLNSLNDKNEQLQQENDKYRVMINANASLNDEVYEQLKKTEKSYKECREENEQLRTQLMICQQSKNENGGFQVWEIPPIPKGKRISFTTNDDDR